MRSRYTGSLIENLIWLNASHSVWTIVDAKTSYWSRREARERLMNIGPDINLYLIDVVTDGTQ